ncbi:MAG: DNA repair protein RadC [Clostridia bacterium]|nr:DNA repair protein RadC [Clostridia bacterium]
MAEEHNTLHEKHRERLKEKFLEFGLDGLEDHELVELLLFYAVPRQNTNEIAHRLINEYGRISDILEADTENLMKIKGISKHSAVLFKLILASVNKYMNEQNDIANAMLTPQNIDKYIKNLFYGHTNEVAYALLLDKECVVKKVKKLSTGTVNAAPIYPREVVKLAVNEKYPYILLAHNHPNGNAMPSQNDLKITKTIELALNFVEVRLVDHVIVSGEKVISLAKNYKILEK